MKKEKIIVKEKEELIKLIDKEIEENGLECDLNHLDVSNLTDLSLIFNESEFNGDISKWNTSNVINMSTMFANSKFNGDISGWDVNKVKDMLMMFSYSKFNGNLSKWDVSNVENMFLMFTESKFTGDISKWNVSKVENMSSMFYKSEFNGNLSSWDVSNVKTMLFMFIDSEFNRYKDLNNWKPYNIISNNIFNNKEKKQVYWSSENIDLEKEDIKSHINKYFAEKEKELLIDQNKNQNNTIKLNSKEKFKI